MNELHESINDLLQRRKEIEEELMGKFGKKLTVMFTDMKGSTEIYELDGDIEGRAIIKEHNDILIPIIKDHGGRVVKTIGDAIMAGFSESTQAVIAAVQMQEALQKYNASQEKKIRIRIGLHTGAAIEEPDDIYGDVVNTAARVEGLAYSNQILISESTYQDIGTIGGISFHDHGSYQLKGRGPLSIHETLWYVDQKPIKPKGQMTKRDEKELLAKLGHEYHKKLDNQLKK